MNTSTARFAGLVVIVSCMLSPAAALAQYRPLPVEDPEVASGGKGGAYFKAGLAYWQGDIFSESSLTQWNVDLFGAEYDLTSVSVEIDAYLGSGVIVPGFSLGYRKDDIRSAEAGHMVSAAVFGGVDLKLLMIKVGGGAEWGVPSMTFDQTEFAYDADGTVRYRHTYPSRNAQVPVGTRSSGALYPFAVVSAVARPGPFLFEAGMRVNLIEFRFDDYEIRPGDQVTHASAERRVKMPFLFANVGFRLF
jgi:hypothetical protein